MEGNQWKLTSPATSERSLYLPSKLELTLKETLTFAVLEKISPKDDSPLLGSIMVRSTLA